MTIYRPRRIALAAAAVGVAAALTLAGCSSNSSPSNSSSSSKTNADATLNVGALLAPTNLDVRSTSGAALDQALLDNVYQGLVTLDGDGKIVPAIAKSWTISSDGLTYDFTLNKGVTFSDGHTLTTDDVVSSLEDAIKNEKTYVDAAGLVDVTSVAATNDSTIELKLDKPNIETLWVLAGRAGIILEKGATNDLKTTSVATGPFTVSDFQANTSLTLTRNPKYWGTKAGVKEVEFHYYADAATAVNAALAGDLQVLVTIDPTLLPKFTSNQDFSVVPGRASDKFQLGFNNTDPVLKDKDVRVAIREAIDPKAIIAAVGGAGKPLGGPIADGDPGYEDLTSIDAYNPDDAKAKLAAAGVTKLSLTLPSAYGTTLTDVLSTELKAVGVTLDVKQVDFNTWLSQVYTAGDYQLTIVDHVESHDFGTQWTNPQYYHHYDNAEVQSLYEKAIATTSSADEGTILAQAAKIVSEDAADEWLYQSEINKAIATGVKGVPANNTNSRLNLSSVTVAAK